MSKRFLIVAAAAVAALALVAAGCGGGGKKGYALTKAEYGSALNKLCADVNAKQKEIGAPQSIKDIAELGPQLNAALADGIEQAKKLTPPDDEKATAEAFIAKSEQQHDLLDDLIKAAKDGDSAKVNEIGTEVAALDNEANDLARQLGAPACAED